MTRHGATQPETERLRKQVLLRLPPDLVTKLDRFAAANDWPRSYLVEAALRLVLRGYESGEPLDVQGELPDELTAIGHADE